MRSGVRLLLLAALLAFAAGCNPKKEEEPVPNNQNQNNSNANNNNNNNNNNTNNQGNTNSNEPDPSKIELPGDNIKIADLLTSEVYKNLVVEIVGTPPSSRAIGNLTFFLQQRIQKSKVIIRLIKGPALKVDSVGLGHLKQYEKDNRKKSVVGDTVFVWVEFLNARSNNKTANFKLSDTYGKSSIAVYAKTLNDLTLPDMITRFTLETYLLEHEFGHLLGLVNGGTSMKTPHQDEAHGNHCTNKQCLMYWIADENIRLEDLLSGMNLGSTEVLPILDANCVQDLQAAGGK
ncbi:MAG TPA: hypothetical protein VFE50_06080 [Cyclobacteriaceae bacterium]|nr:hypothetical protein [Cyclobacteriaceae bacterium]